MTLLLVEIEKENSKKTLAFEILYEIDPITLFKADLLSRLAYGSYKISANSMITSVICLT